MKAALFAILLPQAVSLEEYLLTDLPLPTLLLLLSSIQRLVSLVIISKGEQGSCLTAVDLFAELFEWPKPIHLPCTERNAIICSGEGHLYSKEAICNQTDHQHLIISSIVFIRQEVSHFLFTAEYTFGSGSCGYIKAQWQFSKQSFSV